MKNKVAFLNNTYDELLLSAVSLKAAWQIRPDGDPHIINYWLSTIQIYLILSICDLTALISHFFEIYRITGMPY